jgi:hypothetical protein
VQEHLYEVQRELAYLDFQEGQHKAARQRTLRLIHTFPLRAQLYIDLVKTYLSAAAPVGWRTTGK